MSDESRDPGQTLPGKGTIRIAARGAPSQYGLKAVVMNDLRNQIFSGNYRPGERLSQDLIAERLGVSKIPVREALITLEAVGLIVNVPRRGSYVAELTRDDIRDTFQLFGAVSAIATQRAAASMPPNEIARLRAILYSMENERNAEVFAAWNGRFHALIHHHGSSRTRALLRSLVDGLPDRFFEAADAWHDESHHEHSAIVDAIELRDQEAATQWTLKHFNRNGELALHLLEDAHFWPDDNPEVAALPEA